MSDQPARSRVTKIYNSGNYNIYGRIIRPDGPVFVSFMLRNHNPQSFGEAVFLKYGLNAVHVLGRGPHWYQYADTDLAGAAIRDFVKNFSSVITYGTSMGGYAALLFSGPVGADLVLSFSPQFSVDPRKVPFEKRWLGDLGAIESGGGFVSDDMAANLTPTGRVVIAYDSLDDDGKHVELIRKIRPISDLRMPFSKHRSLTVLAEMGLASRILRKAAEDDLDLAAFRQEVRGLRNKSATYLRYLGREFEIRKKPNAGILLERAAARTKPDDYEGIEGNFRLLLRHGAEAAAVEQFLLLLNSSGFVGRPNSIRDVARHINLLSAPDIVGRAETALKAHIDRKPDSAAAHQAAIMLARLWHAAKEPDRALGHVFGMIARGGLPKFAFDLANFFDELGKTDAALAMAEMAHRAFPERIEIAYFLSDRLERLDRIAEAIAVYDAFDAGQGLPDDPYRLRYTRLLRHIGKLPEALAQCDTFLANLPNHMLAHRMRGGLLAAMSRHQEACVAFENCVALGGNNAGTLEELATSLRETGRSSEAAAAARRAYGLEPQRTGLLRFIATIETGAAD